MLVKQEPSDQRYCIALQPIFDPDFKHVADELLYRSHDGAVSADITNPLVATARACSAAFYEIGLDALVGSRQLYLNVSEEWLAQPDLLPLPTHQVVIQLPDACCNLNTVSNLRRAKEQGYTLAATATWALESDKDLLGLIDIICVDVRKDYDILRLQQLQSQGCQLLAAFIETTESLVKAQADQFDLYQGYFYALPQAIPSQGRGPRKGNRAADMKLLKTLYSADVALQELEHLIVQDPHLCTLLFRQVNSASERRKHSISSVSQAIMLLGLDKIRALTATLVLASNEPIKRLLVLQMLIRAQMARQLAVHLNKIDPDMAFTTGLFSMMDQLEGVDLKVILDESAMDKQVKSALLEYKGDLGKLLKIIESFESASLEKRSLKQVEMLNHTYLTSVAWAQEMMTMAEETE